MMEVCSFSMFWLCSHFGVKALLIQAPSQTAAAKQQCSGTFKEIISSLVALCVRSCLCVRVRTRSHLRPGSPLSQLSKGLQAWHAPSQPANATPLRSTQSRRFPQNAHVLLIVGRAHATHTANPTPKPTARSIKQFGRRRAARRGERDGEASHEL